MFWGGALAGYIFLSVFFPLYIGKKKRKGKKRKKPKPKPKQNKKPNILKAHFLSNME